MLFYTISVICIDKYKDWGKVTKNKKGDCGGAGIPRRYFTRDSVTANSPPGVWRINRELPAR